MVLGRKRKLIDTGIFHDKDSMPSTDELKKVLGKSFVHWDAILAFVHSQCMVATDEWTNGGEKYGWRLLIKDTKRILVSLTPHHNAFKVVFVFGIKAYDMILSGRVSKRIKNDLKNAQVNAEGREVGIDVRNKLVADEVKTMIAIKMLY
ncbi:MAG: DUF3788 family protein [Bacteroidota bacterium]